MSEKELKMFFQSYTTVMTEVKLTLTKDERAEKDYVLSRLALHSNVKVTVEEFKKFTTICVRAESDTFFSIVKDIISSVILIFYKFRILREGITAIDTNDISHYALLGAFLSFDSDQEAVLIEKGLEPNGSYALKTIYEFRHPNLKESWNNIVTLANKLISQCESQSEIYDLIFFLLAVDEDLAPKVRIETLSDKLKIFCDNLPIIIPKLTDNEHFNHVIAIVRERPASIVICEPATLNKELLAAIKKLGN
jgi:hypothetical protein